MFEGLQKKIVAVDIDEGSVVAVELTKKQNEAHLSKYSTVFDLKELAKDSFFKNKGLVINLPTQVFLFRTFPVAHSFLSSENKQKEIIAFLSHKNLPFKLDECYWGTFTLDSHLNLIAVKKEVAQKYIAQVQDLGLRVTGVTAPLVALYNVLIYTYPEREKDRFALLNIRSASCELIIYEDRQLWVYPLSIGKRNLYDTPGAMEKFSLEVQRAFNAHYLQYHPSITQKTGNYFYIAGQGCGKELILALKKVLTDFEVRVVEPLGKIRLVSKGSLPNQEAMSLSLGLGLTYLGLPFCFKINLIKEKIKKEQRQARLIILKKISSYLLIFMCILLLFWNATLIKNLKNQISISRDTQLKILQILPEAKILKEEKDRLQRLNDFLEKSLSEQELYLASLAAISESKPSSIALKELDAQIKDTRLHVVLTASAPTYHEINDFLTGLKKVDYVEEAKVVASSFSAIEPQEKGIDFKLRFEISRKNIQEKGRVLDSKANYRYIPAFDKK